MTISGAQLWYIGLIGLFSASLPLYLLGLVYEGGIGGGDIKLMAAAGLLAGWKLILLSLFLGAIYASFLALFMVIFRKATFKTALPFGPFLAAGIVTAILFGQSMLNAYMDFYQYIL